MTCRILDYRSDSGIAQNKNNQIKLSKVINSRSLIIIGLQQITKGSHVKHEVHYVPIY